MLDGRPDETRKVGRPKGRYKETESILKILKLADSNKILTFV